MELRLPSHQSFTQFHCYRYIIYIYIWYCIVQNSNNSSSSSLRVNHHRRWFKTAVAGWQRCTNNFEDGRTTFWRQLKSRWDRWGIKVSGSGAIGRTRKSSQVKRCKTATSAVCAVRTTHTRLHTPHALYPILPPPN